jgi:peptide deformylase
VSPRTLPIVALGDPVLRQVGRELTRAELLTREMQALIERMRETMRRAPGVGLAAPQIGQSLKLAVIEDRPENVEELSAEERATREREAVPFHVVVNPTLEAIDASPVRFFEGCLSLSGYVAVVARAHAVRVRCLDARGEPLVIEARGWYARILQHEIDHLNGVVYVDRMETRTFMSADDCARHWGGLPVDVTRGALDAARALPGA